MKRLLNISCCLLAVLCSGCQSLGAKAVKTSHPQLNSAMTSSVDEQLLTNLVRLRYRENPLFLEITSINDSWRTNLDAGLDRSEILIRHESKTARGTWMGPKIMFSESQSPTVSYKPLRGKEFIKQMMTPVPLNVVLGLSESGWKLPRVFGLCVERINNIENAPSASGPTPYLKPNFEQFFELTELLKEMEDAHQIAIGVDNGKNLVMQLTQNGKRSPKADRFKKLLGLDANQDSFVFQSSFMNTASNGLVVRTRSLMSILFYLSHAVEVPEKDIENGVVTQTVDENGQVFDWKNNASGTFLKIHCSHRFPENVFIATKYRGNWFYIEDSDLHSKSTFMFISTLFNLQTGEASANDVVPMLALPVGK